MKEDAKRVAEKGKNVCQKDVFIMEDYGRAYAHTQLMRTISI